MALKENSRTFIPPLLLRNLLTFIFIHADKSLLHFAQKYKLLEYIRYLLATSFLFFLRLLPSLFPSLNPPDDINKNPHNSGLSIAKNYVSTSDSGIGRALSQLLSITSEIPVSSRKYEVVRSLAETIIDENHRENVEALHEVNGRVLSAAFSRTLAQLETAMMEVGCGRVDNDGLVAGPVKYRMKQVLKAVRIVARGRWNRSTWGINEMNPSGGLGEKLAAELLWLAQKLVACGCGEVAVSRWASASNLAWLSLSAEPRLQGSLAKVSAFLFKQAKDLGLEEFEEGKKEQHRATKLNMLISWLPLLCRNSNGTDVPIFSTMEKADLERVLEETIEMLKHEEEQEQVLSLWLHHFTHCSSSDWPNLRASYARWCSASRKSLILK